jgi:hypothetical protein
MTPGTAVSGRRRRCNALTATSPSCCRSCGCSSPACRSCWASCSRSRSALASSDSTDSGIPFMSLRCLRRLRRRRCSSLPWLSTDCCSQGGHKRRLVPCGPLRGVVGAGRLGPHALSGPPVGPRHHRGTGRSGGSRRGVRRRDRGAVVGPALLGAATAVTPPGAPFTRQGDSRRAQIRHLTFSGAQRRASYTSAIAAMRPAAMASTNTR